MPRRGTDPVLPTHCCDNHPVPVVRLTYFIISKLRDQYLFNQSHLRHDGFGLDVRICPLPIACTNCFASARVKTTTIRAGYTPGLVNSLVLLDCALAEDTKSTGSNVARTAITATPEAIIIIFFEQMRRRRVELPSLVFGTTSLMYANIYWASN